MENLITLTVKSTHFYLIDCLGGKLLIDAGWELSAFSAQLKQYRVPFSAIRYVMFTHHHPDHAGLIQDVRSLSGAKLIIHEKQIPYLENLRAFYAKKGGYTPIRVDKSDLVSPNRAALQAIGIQGEIVETPGHSDDSISLALEHGFNTAAGGSAFIGDLTSPDFVEPNSESAVLASWRKLLNLGVETFYHSHTDPMLAERIKKMV